jgi:hypothetical protein
VADPQACYWAQQVKNETVNYYWGIHTITVLLWHWVFQNITFKQLDWICDWIIFSFFTDMPPMRPQNAVLKIMTQIQLRGSQVLVFVFVLCCIFFFLL